MITKFNQFLNESLLNKMKGKSVDEIWKSYGFNRIFDTPEDYFLYLTKDIDIVSPNGLYYQWLKDGKIIFEQYPDSKYFIMLYNKTFKIYENIFDMNFNDFQRFIRSMFKKYFNNQIEIYEYIIKIDFSKWKNNL